MNKISILDCTLRDGGYVNKFQFGNVAIKNIISGLSRASIDIIECGFLKENACDENQSVFQSVSEIDKVIEVKNPNCMYVAMIQFGAISPEKIDICEKTLVDGIRLTFHEHEIDEAFVVGRELMNKGYKVFMQPVGTTTYEDRNLLELIEKVNKLQPYAFYIVDTLGTMYKNDLLRLFYLVDYNLDDSIILGFHSHNNLQMSFANAQELTQLKCKRKIIIDASILGMGRGAGNLNTELLVQYLNVNLGYTYSNFEIMNIVDNYIRPLKAIYKWGYDVAYYLAATKKCHPNYASFLLNLQTLTMRDMDMILNSIEEEKRSLFNEAYILELYEKYMNHFIDDSQTLKQIKNEILEKKVVVIAPGKSVNQYTKKADNEYVISVNFIPECIDVDMLYVSNLKRFENLVDIINFEKYTTVFTSNIVNNCIKTAWIINYFSYLNNNQIVRDNAGLMCLNMLEKIGVREILLVGFDGFMGDIKENYYEDKMYLDVDEKRLRKINIATAERIKQLQKKININFISNSLYEKIMD